MLLKTYTVADLEAAMARTNGIALSDLGGSSAARRYSAQGSSPYVKGTGHAYAHMATYTQRLQSNDASMSRIRANQSSKSLWQNRRMAIYACMELLNRDVKVREWLKKFDDGRRAEPIDVKSRPLVGDYYGYKAGDSILMKVSTAAINIVSVGGELGIFSTYPCDLVGFTEPDLDMSWLFPG